jgi:hypothetical protein
MPEQQAPAVATPPMETPAPLPKGPIKAAVYVTGVPDLVGKTLNSAISSALIKSKIYAGIESINVNGAPSIPALADAGRNAGVSYIFAINVAGQISVAIIDVAGTMELAKISIDGKITAISAAAIAKKIVDFILTSGPKPDPDALVAEGTEPVQSVGDVSSDDKPRILQNGFGGELAMGYIYGSYKHYHDDTVSLKRTVREPVSGGGFSGSIRGDLKYFESYIDVVGLVSLDSSPVVLVVGLLAKYPFVLDQVPVKVSPILGFGGMAFSPEVGTGGFIFGGRIDVGISKTAYLRPEYLYDLGVGKVQQGNSGMSLKAGGGLDVRLGKKKETFWRTELTYNWRSVYNQEYTKNNIYRVDSKSAIHYVDIKTIIGGSVVKFRSSGR